MEMDFTIYGVSALAVIPVLMEFIKRYLWPLIFSGQELQDRMAVVVTVGLGLVLALIAWWAGAFAGTFGQVVFVGIFTGLGATGVFSGLKKRTE